jgi:hypothetical protein
MKLTMKLSLVVAILLVPATALAQSGTSSSAVPLELSTLTAVTTILNLLVGALTQAQQSGKILGQWSIPPGWMVAVGIVLPLASGIGAYLGTASAVNATTIFYAVAAGVTDLLASSASGVAVHAHLVVPAKMAALRTAKVSSAVTLPPAVGK